MNDEQKAFDGLPNDHPHPYDFSEARLAAIHAARSQEAAEQTYVRLVGEAADADGAYRLHLAQRITALKKQWPATVCETIARGEPETIRLRRAAKYAEGVVTAQNHALYRLSGNRQSVHGLTDWSKKVAPDGQVPPHAQPTGETYGGRF